MKTGPPDLLVNEKGTAPSLPLRMVTSLLSTVFLLQTPGLSRETIKVGDLERTFLVRKGPSPNAPTVLAFHGHGGSMGNSARSFQIHSEWPEATVIYPQGLPTKTGNDPRGERPGWHNNAGENGDRDLKFVDALLDWASKEKITDPKRVYAMGHSNGGRFTYLLWSTRGEKFAAFAPSAAAGRGLDLKPASVLIVAGKNDQVVPFSRQEDSIDMVRKLLKTETSVPSPNDKQLTFETGLNQTTLGLYIHDGTHSYPRVASKYMVDFFKSKSR